MQNPSVSNSLKVLFLCEWYPNRNDAFNGLFIHNHAKAVSDFCKVTVIYAGADNNLLSKKYDVEDTFENNLRIIKIYYKIPDLKNNLFGKAIKFYRYYTALFQGLKIFLDDNGRPDIIHANVAGRASFAALILKKLKRIPYILTEHWTGYIPRSGKFKGFFKKYFTRIIIKNANTVTIVSENLKNCMLAHNLQGNYEIVPNVINTNIVVQRNYPDKIIALNISDLVDDMKNVSGIIKTVAEIIHYFPDFELHILGQGPDKEKLVKYATKLNLLNRNVFFFDYVPHEKVYEKIASSSFLVVNSRYETFSVVAAEALACGVPVLTTRCGGPEEFINNEYGKVIEPGNHEQLLEGIKWMCQNYKKFDCEKLKSHVRSEFSENIVANKFLIIYQREMQNVNK